MKKSWDNKCFSRVSCASNLKDKRFYQKKKHDSRARDTLSDVISTIALYGEKERERIQKEAEEEIKMIRYRAQYERVEEEAAADERIALMSELNNRMLSGDIEGMNKIKEEIDMLYHDKTIADDSPDKDGSKNN